MGGDINLKRKNLDNIRQHKENDLQVYIREVKQYLINSKTDEIISKDYIILNIDDMQKELPYELLYLENFINNFDDIHIINKHAINEWCDCDRKIYYTTSEKTNLEFTQASNINHLNDSRVHRIHGYIDSITEFKKIPKSYTFKCPTCDKEVNSFREKPKPVCTNVSCLNHLRQKMDLEKVNYVSRKYFVINSSTTASKQSIIKCYFEINDNNKDGDYIFDDHYVGKKVDLLCYPDTLVTFQMKKKTEEYVLKLLGIKIHKSFVVTKSDKKRIKETIKKEYDKIGVKIFEDICYSMSKKVYGHNYLRQAILCSAIGLNKEDSDFKNDINPAFNIMLLGDPSVGKTFSAKQFLPFFENSAYIQGISTTTVGLLGGCDKIPEMGMIIRAGQLVKSDNSFILLDEVDKMPEEQHKGLFTALSEGQHSITNIKGNFNFEYNTSFIMVANPKGGKFDAHSTVRSQINLNPAFLSRVDIATIVRRPYEDENGDIDNDKHDEYMNYRTRLKSLKVKYNEEFLTQYAVVVKEQKNPIINTNIKKHIKEYFSHIFMEQQKALKPTDTFSNAEDKVIKTIDERYINTIMKLSKIIARACLCDNVDIEHFDKAVQILEETMLNQMEKQFGTTSLTEFESKIRDSNKTKIPTSKNDKAIWVRNYINENSKKEPIPYEEIIKKSEDIGITEQELEDSLIFLKNKGEIFEPKRDFYKGM